jgi:hypothetical protein
MKEITRRTALAAIPAAVAASTLSAIASEQDLHPAWLEEYMALERTWSDKAERLDNLKEAALASIPKFSPTIENVVPPITAFPKLVAKDSPIWQEVRSEWGVNNLREVWLIVSKNRDDTAELHQIINKYFDKVGTKMKERLAAQEARKEAALARSGCPALEAEIELINNRSMELFKSIMSTPARTGAGVAAQLRLYAEICETGLPEAPIREIAENLTELAAHRMAAS